MWGGKIMRGRQRGSRSYRGGYSEEQRGEGRSRQGNQRGYPDGGWGDEREWEGEGSMGGYRSEGGRRQGQGGGWYRGEEGYESQSRYQAGQEGRRGRGEYQGSQGYQGGGRGYRGQYGDEYDSQFDEGRGYEGGYDEQRYQGGGGYDEGEYQGRGGFSGRGRWGTRAQRSFPGSTAFGGGSGGYGREYEGSSEDREREGSYGNGWSFGGQGGMGSQGTARRRGQHSGKGPKGYQRSDERIREDVSEALSQHGDLDASEISVDVRGGEVTLTGTVDSREAKREAERAIENEPGVKEVQNQLRVRERKSEREYQGSESGTSQQPRSGSVPSADQQSESRGRSRSSSQLGANV
jgi:osmotically-inducible protein OsmY